MKHWTRGLLLGLLLFGVLAVPARAYPLRELQLGSFSLILKGDARADYADGVLRLSGDVRVSGGAPGERIVAEESGELTLCAVTLAPEEGAGITLGPGCELRLILADGTVNEITGGENYAGIQVSWDKEAPAALVIDGGGALLARGGRNAAGIGGSFDAGVYYGDITLAGGSVWTWGGSNASGLGSAVNALGERRSFKMEAQPWGVITIAGGRVEARGDGSGAGIGGGNHADSGEIRITGGIVDASGASGIGSGVGSADQDRNGGKGPGYYWGKVEILGGTVTARGGDNGAGIGGAMYSDGQVSISGGTVTARGGGGTMSRHGGAGIGGGFEGHGQVEISGGTVEARGGGGAAGIGSGGGANSNGDRGRSARGLAAQLKESEIRVSGGSVTAAGGGTGGAGIGGGVGADGVSVSVSGGEILTRGSESVRAALQGGAGLGSGFSGQIAGTNTPYAALAKVNVTLSGGRVEARGGWGAAAVGGGAYNMAAQRIEIGPEADLTAFADGSRFALDNEPGEDGAIPGERLGGGFLQATFADLAPLGQTALEGQSVTIRGEETQETLQLPPGYRSFVRSLPAGEYTLALGEELLGAGETEQSVPERLSRGHVFPLDEESFADVYFLSPMVTVTAEFRWDDADDLDRTRRDAVLRLFQDDASREEDARWIPAEGEGPERSAQWTDLPRYSADGTGARDYGVLADPLEGYTWESETVGDTVSLRAVHGPDRGSVSGRVIWLGVDRELRPESLELLLRQNGEDYDTVEARPGESGLWTWSAGPVLRSLDRQEIPYSVSASQLRGWLAVPCGRDLLIAPLP